MSNWLCWLFGHRYHIFYKGDIYPPSACDLICRRYGAHKKFRINV